MRSASAVAALAAALVLAVAPGARAGEEESPFELHPAVDATVIALASAYWALPVLFDDVLAQGDCAPCDPSGVNGFDRTVIGNDSAGARTASDVGIIGLPALAGLGALLDAREFGWSATLEDAVLVAEAITISGAVNQVVKNLALRPRPYMYVEETAAAKGRGRENFRSFYSGHTALAFSASVSFAYVFSVRRPESPWRYAVWALAVAASSAVGVCRVLGGMHFWTDVIVGAAAGSAFGVLVPALHLRKRRAGGPEARAVAGPGYASLYVRF